MDIRVGDVIKMKCLGCGHQVLLARKLVEKNVRGLTRPQQENNGEG